MQLDGIALSVTALDGCVGSDAKPPMWTQATTIRTERANLMASLASFPTRSVRLIEPFGRGGGPDEFARALAPELARLWDQTVGVENHPGAGSTAAPNLVAKAAPDGYTLLVTSSAQAYSSAVSSILPYDPVRDFVAIAPLTSQPYVLVVGGGVGISTLTELLAADD